MPDGAPIVIGVTNTGSSTNQTRLRAAVTNTPNPGAAFNVESDNPSAVAGWSVGTQGVLGVGITGVNQDGNFNGVGVSGQGFGTGGAGVIASGLEGFGVIATGRTGAYAQGEGVGVHAYSASGVGVFAGSESASGVEARSTTGAALSATSDQGPGAMVSSRQGPGIVAQSGAMAAAHCTTTSGIAVRGISAPQGWSGYFEGRVGVEGAVTVLGGPISEAVGPPLGNGAYRRLYCHESPDSYIEDFGRAQLSGGSATVQLRPDYAALIQSSSYDVFLTAYGPVSLYVQSRSVTSFRVSRIGGGGQGASAQFAYRIVGRPRASRPRLEPVQMVRATLRPRLTDTLVRRATKKLTGARTTADLMRRADKALSALAPVRKIRKRARKRPTSRR